ncbi:MAG: hypothetical protein RI564_10645 [Gracilimonas sp.]|nr:hypothetical protein [Gracilimonas sp.]
MDEDEQLSLVYQDDLLHGLGVQPISSYNPDDAFKKACEDALEDLNSNIFLSVYIEMFKSNDRTLYDFPELSVRDTVLSYENNVVKRDSFAVQDKAFCVAGITNNSTPMSRSTPPLNELMVSPVKVGNTWFAIGKAKSTKYNPTIAWMKAKNDAIQELTKVLKTSVQSLSRRVETNSTDQSAEMTYFKSNMIYNNIYNVSRYASSRSFVVVIAVRQQDILEY